jgi:hypothetical protein
MTASLFEAALCLQCNGAVIAMHKPGLEELCKIFRDGQETRPTVETWAVFCRKHSPPNTDEEDYDYAKVLVKEDEVLQSHAMTMLKSFMSPSVLNPVQGNDMIVRPSLVYPLAVTDKMTRVFLDMTSESIVISTVPSGFM